MRINIISQRSMIYGKRFPLFTVYRSRCNFIVGRTKDLKLVFTDLFPDMYQIYSFAIELRPGALTITNRS